MCKSQYSYNKFLIDQISCLQYSLVPACDIGLFSVSRFRLRGLLIIVGVLAGISFITTAVLYAHYDLAAAQLGAAAQVEQ